ncbi:acetylornithine transaminase [Amycolatopsis azurea]|uniref:acetylornithine transaminase n=1 Tax=Amycolatopsis azurea TaxID=36819 RepID=UPI00380C4FAB
MTSTATRTETDGLRARFGRALMPTYGTPAPPIALAAGRGCRVRDVDGRSYLDLIGGLSASSLGHGHPDLAAAIARQAGELVHTSNQFLHEREVELAERLRDLLDAPDARVYLCNSGTEATEAALKLARHAQGRSRPVVVAAEGAFHGRTMGALPMAGVPAIRDPFTPFGVDVRFVPFGDAAALAAAVRDDTAAVFLEPVQGEAGVVSPPGGYLRAAREACDAAGALLVLDEIQSGIGRTGRWFAHQAEGIVPDVMTLSKGLGGGMPIAACVGFGACAGILVPGTHGSTFGGNPVACAAALAVLSVIERDGLLDNATRVGAALAENIRAVEHPLLTGVRGRGLWLAITLAEPVSVKVCEAAAHAGFLVNPVRPDTVRLAPPLILTAAEADEFCAALPGILTDAAG